MDREALIDIDFNIDLEVGGSALFSEEDSSKGVKNQAMRLITKICVGFGDENRISLPSNVNHVTSESDNVKVDVEFSPISAADKESSAKDKRNKKCPKPPRPPKGPALDASDHKLIAEITELAKLKRARIERMKALKKMKAAKSSSSSSNSFALVFTILFCLVIIFQGMSSRKTSASFHGSPISAVEANGRLISIQYIENPSTSALYEPGSLSLNSLVKHVAEFDNQEKLIKTVPS